MKEYTNRYTKKLHSELEPLVGTIIAQSILKKIADKLGKSEESLSTIDRPEIVKGIEKGIAVFLGSETASKVVAKIGQIS